MFIVILILIWCVVFSVWWRIKPRHPSPPVYPGALPLIGHAHLLYGDDKYLWNFEKKLYRFSSKNGGVTKIRFGPHSVYVVTDLEDSLVIANTCFDKPYIYGFAKDVYGRGLVTANFSTWKPHRKLLNPAFNQQVLNMFIHEYSTQARCFVSQLASQVGKDPFDVRPYFIKYFVKIVYSTSLGIKSDYHSETTKNYTHATEDLFAIISNRFRKFWLHLPYLFNRSYLKKKHDTHKKIITDITNTVIQERKSELKASNSLRNDRNATMSPDKFKPLLDKMINLSQEKDAFTDDEIREHLDTIVAAAYGTSAAAMTFTLILIGSHQDVQAKIFKELREVIGDKDRDLNKNDLPRLVYMEAVIKESLRLIPPVPRIAKNINSNVKLKNYVLPADCTCVISVYNINRDPMWGADAEQFKPERWLDPATLPDNPNAFASFSLGKRNCIGKLYAMMAMKTTLAHILRHYRITGDISNVKTTSDTILRPVSGHHISLELRK